MAFKSFLCLHLDTRTYCRVYMLRKSEVDVYKAYTACVLLALHVALYIAENEMNANQACLLCIRLLGASIG